MKNIKILLDNGHGIDTPGKRSPDGTLREYKYTREIAEQIASELKRMGYDAERIVVEDKDVSLQERCKRVNNICSKLGKENVLLVSVHVNAAGNGDWKTAGGWCCYTSPGQTRADKLATCMYREAEVALKDYIDNFETNKIKGCYDKHQKPIRTDFSDKDPDYEANFYILKHTQCPAVLTESLFQDNKKDCEFLLSEGGRKAIVDIHIKGIVNYINTYC